MTRLPWLFRAIVLSVAVVVLCGSASASVIYYDTFDGPAGTFNKGRAPAPVNTLGATWSEPGTPTTLNGSGQAVQTGNTTCFLPFQFTDPGTYVLSASLAHPSSAGGQLYMGFASTDYTSGDHYGQAWQYGGAMVQFSGNGGINLFYNNPPHESNPIKAGVNVGGGKTDTFTFTVAYDGGNATLTVTDTLNSFGAAGFTTAMTNVGDIRHVFFGTRQYPTTLQAQVDDFQLTYVPEPATLTLLAISCLALVRRRNG